MDTNQKVVKKVILISMGNDHIEIIMNDPENLSKFIKAMGTFKKFSSNF